MSVGARLFSYSLIAVAIGLVAVLALVEFRSRSPEWKKYQKRGIELALERCQGELSSTRDPEKRKALLARMASLQNQELRVIEISPFGGKMAPERCMTCHYGIEDLSSSHPNSVFGCVSCHGGNGPDLTVAGAHIGLRGGRNPARLDLAPISCGTKRPDTATCHSFREHPLLNRVDTVPRSLMATNAGIISILRFQWGVQADTAAQYGVRQASDGKTSLKAVPSEVDDRKIYRLAESHFRKFCSDCHLWGSAPREDMGRLEGCPACHAPYGEKGRYRGGDPTINRDEPGHAETHTITNLIPDARCRACHNRSARIGLNYHGEMESAQYGTPFVRGGLNDQTLPDKRFVLHLAPDIHREKGMACIDCHTGQDTMGDGTIHAHMEDQIEIRCEDCHGTHSAEPKTMKVRRDDPLVQGLIRSSVHAKPEVGDTIVLTSKGRPLIHVRKTDKGFVLTGKLTGKEHKLNVITGKKNAHTIAGHKRMACDSCHSAWSPQCFACHQLLDFRHKSEDGLSAKMTRGRWAEGRGHFRWARHIYGIDSRGRVGILVPGCQVWNSVIDEHGRVVPPYDSKIMPLKNGNTSLAMGPIHPHTTRTKVPRCVDCHLDSKALGLGDGRLSVNGTKKLSVEPLYDSSGSGLGIHFPIDAAVDTGGKVLQGTSHKLSRPFNKKEIERIVGIAPCLPCHDRYDDPVWTKPGPYTMTPACTKAVSQFSGSNGSSE